MHIGSNVLKMFPIFFSQKLISIWLESVKNSDVSKLTQHIRCFMIKNITGHK